MNYGYEGDVVLPVRLRLTGAARSASLSVRADARWLVCREVCLSGKGSLALTIPETIAPDTVESGRLIARSRALVPTRAPASWRATAIAEREHFVLSVTLDRPATKAMFFPLEESQVDDSTPPVVTVSGRTVRLKLRKSNQLVKDPPVLRGVLAPASGGGFEITAPITVKRETK
jgi:thiol:disulfide interchange protein DsbD